MAQLAAGKYAEAFFQIAVDENKVDELNEEARVILKLLQEEEGFSATLLHPMVTYEQKSDIIAKSFEGFSPLTLGFLDIILRKNRESELFATLGIFLSKVEEHRNVLNAEVVSASPLSEEQTENIRKQIESKTNKTVNISVSHDEGLIGGLFIKVGGFVFDTTVKKQLEDMRTALLQ